MLAIDFEGLESKEGVSNSKKAFKRKKMTYRKWHHNADWMVKRLKFVQKITQFTK